MSDTQHALTVRPPEIVRAEDFLPIFTVQQAVERKGMINEFIAKVLHVDQDYGVIPGTGSKPVLLKPGAEKLCSIFGLVPYFEAEETTEDWSGEAHGGEPFFYYRYKCRLFKGERCMGEAVGSANSREAKWRWRAAKRVCPECGQESIIAGKQEYGGGWLCWKKQGGCGNKFESDDKRITEQPSGRVLNPDIADQVNTIQKIAQKRALVPAVLVATNCSDAFTQDLEDIDTNGHAVNTQAAADAVADRKVAELSKRPSVDDEFRPHLAKLEAGKVDECFDWLQHQLIAAGGSDAETCYLSRMKAMSDRVKGQPTIKDLRGAAAVEWQEVLRLRKVKAERDKDQAESAFGVSR